MRRRGSFRALDGSIKWAAREREREDSGESILLPADENALRIDERVKAAAAAAEAPVASTVSVATAAIAAAAGHGGFAFRVVAPANSLPKTREKRRGSGQKGEGEETRNGREREEKKENWRRGGGLSRPFWLFSSWNDEGIRIINECLTTRGHAKQEEARPLRQEGKKEREEGRWKKGRGKSR